MMCRHAGSSQSNKDSDLAWWVRRTVSEANKAVSQTQHGVPRSGCGLPPISCMSHMGRVLGIREQGVSLAFTKILVLLFVSMSYIGRVPGSVLGFYVSSQLLPFP